MSRILIAVFVLASFFVAGLGTETTLGMAPSVARASSITTDDCDEKDWICGEPYKHTDGHWYQDCSCPLNGLTIRRPAF